MVNQIYISIKRGSTSQTNNEDFCWEVTGETASRVCAKVWMMEMLFSSSLMNNHRWVAYGLITVHHQYIRVQRRNLLMQKKKITWIWYNYGKCKQNLRRKYFTDNTLIYLIQSRFEEILLNINLHFDFNGIPTNLGSFHAHRWENHSFLNYIYIFGVIVS